MDYINLPSILYALPSFDGTGLWFKVFLDIREKVW